MEDKSFYFFELNESLVLITAITAPAFSSRFLAPPPPVSPLFVFLDVVGMGPSILPHISGFFRPKLLLGFALDLMVPPVVPIFLAPLSLTLYLPLCLTFLLTANLLPRSHSSIRNEQTRTIRASLPLAHRSPLLSSPPTDQRTKERWMGRMDALITTRRVRTQSSCA